MPIAYQCEVPLNGKDKSVWLVFGTRPEAIKMAPVYRALMEAEGIKPVTCVTAQHREMLDHVLDVFDIRPEFDLDLMVREQTTYELGGRALAGLGRLFDDHRPDMVLVQGDTTTTFVAALAAFYNRIPVGHVEAGLRTGRLDAPFPEEANRVLTTRLASLHFAPTRRSAEALAAEGVPVNSVSVTGNTVVDALQMALEVPLAGSALWKEPEEGRKLILVTAHRRESFGHTMDGIFRALKRISQRGDVEIVIPLHLNPNVKRSARKILDGAEGIQIIKPLEYLPFIHLMSRAHLILTDSGGIQEEAPSLGIPVLVLREVTERPEAAEAGVARVVGTCEEEIYQKACELLDNVELYDQMAKKENPFGDGFAGIRIVEEIIRYLNAGQNDEEAF